VSKAELGVLLVRNLNLSAFISKTQVGVTPIPILPLTSQLRTKLSALPRLIKKSIEAASPWLYFTTKSPLASTSIVAPS